VTSIVIVTFNQLPYTKLCLQSIWRGTDSPYEVIVVDNGSSDGTVAYLKQQPAVKLIENAENCGFPAACNQGINASSGEYVLLLNNDVVAPAGWLGRLGRAFVEHAELGLAGPRTNRVSGPQQVAVAYSDLDDLDKFADEFAAAHVGELQFVTRLVGFCLMIRRQVVERIGLLDERFGIGNFEDDDFCRRAAEGGFKAAIVGDAYVHHFGSVTFKDSGVDFAGLLRKNQKVFEQKWASERPGISLCMIVRDSGRTLGACLESIRPWVDEMIVVDTGSKDNTIEIARSLGAKVFEFPWCDSFAAARNQSLEHASEQWIFWMDSDDTIDPAEGRKLRELAQSALAATMAFIMQVHCPPREGDAYSTETVVDHVKLFRNVPAIRFTGRIHEQILPSIRRLGGHVQWTDAFVRHSGSDISAEGQARKIARDLRLLELELADEPDSTFALFNFGMTLLHAGRAAEAVSAFCRSLQLSTPGESHLRKLYALLAAAYAELGRPSAGLKTCLQGLAICPRDPELTFRKGVLEQALGKFDEAERTYRELLEAPADRYISSIDRGILGVKAWHNLAVVRERQGRLDLAAAAWRKVASLDRGNLAAWRSLIEMLTRLGDRSALEAIGSGREADVPGEMQTIALSRFLAANGDSNTAIARLRSAVEAGASVEVLDELCRRLFVSDDLEEAERRLGDLAELRPADASAHLNLATVFFRRSNYEKAIEHSRRSLELRPKYPPAEELLNKAALGVKRSESETGGA
jgi:GT2 family glycosyltransferase/tetratricopeptide (TPR) repeat protein